jgi:hypothetical protein
MFSLLQKQLLHYYLCSPSSNPPILLESPRLMAPTAPSTLPQLRLALRSTSLPGLIQQIATLETQQGNFRRYFLSVISSINDGDPDFKQTISQAEKEFGDSQRAAEAFAEEASHCCTDCGSDIADFVPSPMQIGKWKDTLNMYAHLWK